MITKEKLNYLYAYRKLTPFEISEVLETNKDEIIKLLKKYNLYSDLRERKYRLINKVPFTDEQTQFIIGCLLGNGRLVKCGKQGYQLLIQEKQKKRLYWKKIMLGNFVNVIQNGFFKTAKHHELNNFWKFFYNNNKKVIREELAEKLTEFSLAIWFLDSAIFGKENIRFSTYKFSSKEEQDILQKILLEKFRLNCKICEYIKHGKKCYYLSFNRKNSQKLIEIVNLQLGEREFNQVFSLLND